MWCSRRVTVIVGSVLALAVTWCVVSLSTFRGDNPETKDSDLTMHGRPNLHSRFALFEISACDPVTHAVSTTLADCEEEDLRLLAEIPSLRAFYMDDGNAYSPAGWSLIGRIHCLTTFFCRADTVTDEHLAGLSGLSNLHDLQLLIRTSPISVAGLRFLLDMPELRRLIVESELLDDQACAVIGQCTKLRSLEVRGSVTNEGLRSIGKLQELRLLGIQGPFADAGLKHLGDLVHLKELTLRSGQLDGSGLSSLRRIPGIRALSIECRSGGPLCLRDLQNWRNLRILNLESPEFGDSHLDGLPYLPQVTSLSLGRTSISDEGLRNLTRLPNLKELNLLATGITHEGLDHLAQLRHLQRLRIGDPQQVDIITDLTPLGRIPQLRQLDMDTVKTHDLKFAPLGQCPELLEVNLSLREPRAIHRWALLERKHKQLRRANEIIFECDRIGRFGPRVGGIP